jgi:hypothetical protein
MRLPSYTPLEGKVSQVPTLIDPWSQAWINKSIFRFFILSGRSNICAIPTPELVDEAKNIIMRISDKNIKFFDSVMPFWWNSRRKPNICYFSSSIISYKISIIIPCNSEDKVPMKGSLYVSCSIDDNLFPLH